MAQLGRGQQAVDLGGADAEQYADFIENEVFDIQDLAEGVEIQRRRFNRMTPPGFSWVQPMFPSVVPFDADNFDEKFLDELLGEDKNSVAIYPLSLTQDPKTRETLVFNAEGKQIATIPADRVSREWPEDADPARVTLLLDLLPAEDVEPYLYTESRIEESLLQRDITRRVTPGRAIARSLGAGEFGICGIRETTNGTMLITVTNGLDAAEVYAYTVAHTSSVVVATWTNEYDEVITSTNVIWHPVSPPFNGIQSDWASRATNLALTGGTGVWEDTNISSNDRVRFYAVAKRRDQDGDGLSDGAEIFLHRTDQQSLDTDGDGLLDGYDISVQMGDPRYSLWANQGILYSESTGMRLFRGELSAGSSPLDDDTDGDGLPDGWEVQNDLDPLDAEGDHGPEGDPDGDGFDNALELELGAPANNAAWNGNELAYRLMHATPVVVTNTRSIITNLVGMRVTVEDSWDCVTGGNPGRQNEVATLEVRDLLECGYYVDIEIEGSVEDVDDGYDMVYFEAHSNNFYFSSHDGIPEGVQEECFMIGENAEKNNLILANSTVVLRYNTVGYRWHSGAYAEIMYATNTGPYKVVVSGEDVICVGETTQMEAYGAAGAPYTWSANGDISVSANGEVTGLEPGIATVIATDAGGCSGEKEIVVIKVESVDILGAPSGGLVVENGDDVTVAAHILPDDFVPPSDEPKWYYQKLNADGTWGSWQSFGATAYGTQYVHTATESGIFRVKTVLTVGGVACEKVYERTADDPYSTLVEGDPDAFGVADTAIQLNVRNTAFEHLGSTYYSAAGSLPSWRDPFGLFDGANKCNVFVADVCEGSGADVDPPTAWVYLGSPPSANNWAGMPDVNDPNAPYPIPNWVLLADDAAPQPGRVCASGYEIGGSSGHAGIIDYDGHWISASSAVGGVVNRKAEFGPSYQRIYLNSPSQNAGQRQYSP